MAWHYVLNGANHGPVTETEIRTLREQNVIALDTPVWTDGLAEWIPFERSTLAGVESGALASVLTHTCAECGKAFSESEMLQYENKWVCAACKPVFFQRIKEGVATKGSLNYASIGGRFAAVLIDGVIMVFIIGIVVMVPFLLVATVVVGQDKTVGQQGWVIALMMIVMYGFPPLYEILFIGKYGATPGKMLMKIKVIRPDGGRVSYGRSTGRYFAKVLSGMILYIGYLMAFWDDEKCALHDRICQSRVVAVNPS